jgi:hypothetical protein
MILASSNDKDRKPSSSARLRQESLEKLQNQLYQAQANNDILLAKKIKLIIDRIKGK